MKMKQQKPRWNKEELEKWYYDEKKTLVDIGQITGVSKERVRQVMERMGFKRRPQKGLEHKSKGR